jgi:hypothetical protein
MVTSASMRGAATVSCPARPLWTDGVATAS